MNHFQNTLPPNTYHRTHENDRMYIFEHKYKRSDLTY